MVQVEIIKVWLLKLCFVVPGLCGSSGCLTTIGHKFLQYYDRTAHQDSCINSDAAAAARHPLWSPLTPATPRRPPELLHNIGTNLIYLNYNLKQYSPAVLVTTQSLILKPTSRPPGCINVIVLLRGWFCCSRGWLRVGVGCDVTIKS